MSSWGNRNRATDKPKFLKGDLKNRAVATPRGWETYQLGTNPADGVRELVACCNIIGTQDTDCIHTVDLSPEGFNENDWGFDRFEPAFFQRETFNYFVDCVRVGISEDDIAANRPSGFGGAFYDFQGKEWNNPTPLEVGEDCPIRVSLDVFIPESWKGTGKYLSLWTRVRNPADTVTRHPAHIIYCQPGFAGNNVVLYATDGTGNAAGGLFTPEYDSWINFETLVYKDKTEYYVNGVLNLTRTETDSFEAGDVRGIILHNYNHPSFVNPWYDDFRVSNIHFEKMGDCCND